MSFFDYYICCFVCLGGFGFVVVFFVCLFLFWVGWVVECCVACGFRVWVGWVAVGRFGLGFGLTDCGVWFLGWVVDVWAGLLVGLGGYGGGLIWVGIGVYLGVLVLAGWV